jgi:excisionase family DNA binding protein
VPQAAEFLGVGKKIVYQLVEFGELKAIRSEGKIWIDPVSLRSFRHGGKMM